MNTTLLRSTLRHYRFLLFWYSIGLLAYGVVIVSLWPLVDTALYREVLASFGSLVEALGGAGVGMGTVGGYVATDYLGIFWVIIAGSALVLYASRSIAKATDDGTLEFTLAQPVSRVSFFVTTICVLVVVDIVIISATLFPLLFLGPAHGLSIPVSRFLLLFAAAFLFMLAVGTFTFMISTFSHSASCPAGVAGGILAFMWVLSVGSHYVGWLAFMKPLNVFTYWTPASFIDSGTFDSGIWFFFIVIILVSAFIGCFRFLKRDIA